MSNVRLSKEVMLEMGSEIIPDSIISFISAQFTSPTRFDRDGKACEMTS